MGEAVDAGVGRDMGGVCNLHVWQPLPGRPWPSSKAEELAFARSLRERVHRDQLESSSKWRRSDASCIMHALRGGVSWEDLEAFLPGLNISRMYNAYLYLHERVVKANAAFEDIKNNPNVYSWVRNVDDLHPMLPLAYQYVADAIKTLLNLDQVKKLTLEIVEKVERRRRIAQEMEELLHGGGVGDRSIHVGRRLFDPYQDSIWTDGLFLPDRVGTLSPLRIGSLVD